MGAVDIFLDVIIVNSSEHKCEPRMKLSASPLIHALGLPQKWRLLQGASEGRCLKKKPSP